MSVVYAGATSASAFGTNTEEQHIYNVLHISDLHFGVEFSPAVANKNDVKNNRDLILRALRKKLKEINNGIMKIHFIVISGDVAWYGRKQEYQQFEQWLGHLLDDLSGSNVKYVVVCPGNHDYNRTKRNSTKIDLQNVNNTLSSTSISKFVKPFQEFSKSMDTMKINTLQNEAKAPTKNAIKHLYGCVNFDKEGIIFAVLNSAWNEATDTTCAERFLGKQLLVDITTTIGKIDDDDDQIVIYVFHHPLNEMNPADCMTGYNCANSAALLNANASIIFNGHTHVTSAFPVVQNEVITYNAGSVNPHETEMRGFEVISINTLRWSAKRYIGIYNGSEWVFNVSESQSEEYFKYGKKARDILVKEISDLKYDARDEKPLHEMVTTILKFLKSNKKLEERDIKQIPKDIPGDKNSETPSVQDVLDSDKIVETDNETGKIKES